VVFVALKVRRHLSHELGGKSLDMFEVADLDVAVFAQESPRLPRSALVIQIGTLNTAPSRHDLIANRAPVTLLNQDLLHRFRRQPKTPCSHT
jgi:hypothetical protein